MFSTILHNHTGCICLAFPHCVFSYVSSKRSLERMHNQNIASVVFCPVSNWGKIVAFRVSPGDVEFLAFLCVCLCVCVCVCVIYSVTNTYSVGIFLFWLSAFCVVCVGTPTNILPIFGHYNSLELFSGICPNIWRCEDEIVRLMNSHVLPLTKHTHVGIRCHVFIFM